MKSLLISRGLETAKDSRVISFLPLQLEHLSFLQRWINTPHVHKWWGENRHWTMADIQHKYSTYVDGYKSVNDIKKPIYPYVIQVERPLVGYIQYYNVHDFPWEGKVSLKGLPKLTAALDLYIGEEDYIGKGLSSEIISRFLHEHVWKRFKACIVDPETENTASIITFNKLSFNPLYSNENQEVLYMIKFRDTVSKEKDPNSRNR